MNWKKHNGTSQPTDDNKQVLVRRSDGSYDSGKASEFRWERRYLGGDARDITDWCEILEPRYPSPIPITRPAMTMQWGVGATVRHVKSIDRRIDQLGNEILSES